MGIIEGEGCFTLNTGNKTPRVQLTIAMTDHDTMEHVARLLGVRCIPVKQRGAYKPVWRVNLYTARATQLALEVLPYMSVRRQERIRELLALLPASESLPLFSFGIAA